MRGKTIIVLSAAAVLLAGCGGSTTTTATDTSSEVATSAAAPATTTPPGGRMNALFCQLNTLDGPYYVQLFNPTKPPGMCTAAVKEYTQEEFGELPGLTRRCIFDSPTDMKQKNGMVSIYSTDEPGSLDAAKLICLNAGYEPKL